MTLTPVGEAAPPLAVLRRVLPHAWSVLLPLLLLGPALGPGYLLSYDMVWVPDLAVRGDVVGAGSGLPRAVPSDAVVAVLDELVPGMLLQKIVLLGALVLAGQGLLRLVGPGLTARLVAVGVGVWSPFVVERLWIGHWPVLLGYAVVPWLVVLGRRWRETGRLPVALLFLVPLGCLGAGGGVVTAVVLLLVALRRGDPRHAAAVVGLAVAGNAPWLVAGLLHAGSATGTAATAVFGLHGEGSVPAPLAALTLGGIWNDQAVPAQREDLLGWVALVGVLLLAGCGGRGWVERVGRPDAVRLGACWLLGYGVAVLTWLAPGGVDQVASTVPGAGVLRDGARYLGLCLPALAGTTAAGAEALVRAAGAGLPRLAMLVAATLFPVMVLTGAAWGIGGRLQPAHDPDDWARARDALASHRSAGDLLVLPLGAFRAPAWNHGRTVLDPLWRYLPPAPVVDDRLRVSGTLLPGDDPRVPRVVAALARPDAASRAAALRALGIRYVAVERDVPGSAPPLPAGTPLVDTPTVQVLRLAGPVAAEHHGAGWWLVLAAGWAAYAGLLLVGLARLATRHFRRRSVQGPTNW